MKTPDILTHQSGRFALPQFQMLGVVFVLWGGYLAYELNLLSILLIVVGFGLATMAFGIQLDLKNELYRSYKFLFGVKWGKWEKIPKIDYISVFVEAYSQQIGVQSITDEDKYRKFKINMIFNENEQINAGLFDDKEKAMLSAKKNSKGIGMQVVGLHIQRACLAGLTRCYLEIGTSCSFCV